METDATQPSMKCFLSYRRADSNATELIGRIFDSLENHFGEGKTFMDVDTIPLGKDFRQVLEDSLAETDILLVIIGNQWPELMRQRRHDSEDFVRIEIESALSREIPVVPILIGDATMPADADLPESISNFRYLNGKRIDPGADFQSNIIRLIADLEKFHLLPVSLSDHGLKDSKDWHLYKIGGKDYVTAENVAQFYRFEQFSKVSNQWIFEHPNLKMRWRKDDSSISINNIQFNLSFPVVGRDRHALLSAVDLAKLIDPVIRPSYIKQAIPFNKVVIDPGRGGHDLGGSGELGIEKDYNLKLALELKQALEKLGVTTVMTRHDDEYVSFDQRVAIANAESDAIFLGIHHNSSDIPEEAGVETFALAPQGTSKGSGENSAIGNVRDAENIALATAVHAHVVHKIKPHDRGVSRSLMNVLTEIDKPAILFEGGFLTNPTEATRIDDSEMLAKEADAIARGILQYRSAVSP